MARLLCTLSEAGSNQAKRADVALWTIYFTWARAKAEDDMHKNMDTGSKGSKATDKPQVAPYTTVPICKNGTLQTAVIFPFADISTAAPDAHRACTNLYIPHSTKT